MSGKTTAIEVTVEEAKMIAIYLFAAESPEDETAHETAVRVRLREKALRAKDRLENVA